jgi:DNA invertase Pin-like site-specific DNA recombinase
MQVAAYVRVSTDVQHADRQRDQIIDAYGEHDITWFVDVESGASVKREQYQDLRDKADEFDAVVTTEIDRLGRSFSELASFVEELRSKDIDVDCVTQAIGTVGEDSWMSEMMMNMMIVFADAERRMIKDRVQSGIDKARRDGKRIGRPPYGYLVEDGFMYQDPAEYNRAQNFIREVKKGRGKTATAEFYEIPESSIQSILERSGQNYEIKFDNDSWRVERAKVESGEKDLGPLSQAA